jgi:cobalt-zinc-cadmium efflux system protein
LAVVAGTIVLSITGWRWIDPALSLLLAAVVVFTSVRLIRESLDVLLESVPRDVDMDALETAIRSIPGVEAMHDLHVWSLTSEVYALSGHLRVSRGELASTDRILEEAKSILKRFGISHTTLQVESEACGDIVCILKAEARDAEAG